MSDDSFYNIRPDLKPGVIPGSEEEQSQQKRPSKIPENTKDFEKVLNAGKDKPTENINEIAKAIPEEKDQAVKIDPLTTKKETQEAFVKESIQPDVDPRFNQSPTMAKESKVAPKLGEELTIAPAEEPRSKLHIETSPTQGKDLPIDKQVADKGNTPESLIQKAAPLQKTEMQTPANSLYEKPNIAPTKNETPKIVAEQKSDVNTSVGKTDTHTQLADATQPTNAQKVTPNKQEFSTQPPENKADRSLHTTEQSNAQPITTTEKPTMAAHKPAVNSIDKQTVPSEKPIVAAEKPIAPAEKPIAPAEKPIVAAEKPIVASDRTRPVDRPMIGKKTDNQATDAQKPTPSPYKPIRDLGTSMMSQSITQAPKKTEIPTQKSTTPPPLPTTTKHAEEIPVTQDRTDTIQTRSETPTEKPTESPKEKPTERPSEKTAESPKEKSTITAKAMDTPTQTPVPPSKENSPKTVAAPPIATDIARPKDPVQKLSKGGKKAAKTEKTQTQEAPIQQTTGSDVNLLSGGTSQQGTVAPLAEAPKPMAGQVGQQIQTIINQIVKHMTVTTTSSQVDTRMTIKNLDGFKGVTVTVTSFPTARGEINIIFENLTQEGKNILDLDENRAILKQGLDQKQFTVHMITTTTSTIDRTFSDTNLAQKQERGDSRDEQSDQRQQNQRDKEKE